MPSAMTSVATDLHVRLAALRRQATRWARPISGSLPAGLRHASAPFLSPFAAERAPAPAGTRHSCCDVATVLKRARGRHDGPDGASIRSHLCGCPAKRSRTTRCCRQCSEVWRPRRRTRENQVAVDVLVHGGHKIGHSGPALERPGDCKWLIVRLAPQAGFEPATLRLTA
jgi:hypothetical protein